MTSRQGTAIFEIFGDKNEQMVYLQPVEHQSGGHSNAS